jgi:predicted nucleic acid-binding protein
VSSRFLVDKSALARMSAETVRRRLAPIIEAGAAATCAIIDLEVLYSARNAGEHAKIRHRRRLAYDRIPLLDNDFERAVDVQAELAKLGRHRLPIPDLIIAAVAERVGLTVLHYDADFETIARVTGQRVEWVVPRGSVDY